jgi:L-ascorbate metabolism protein UlaG (beta-lactamase superfamily)
MQIKWLGHASFLILSQDNTRIVTDPYTVEKGIKYRPIDAAADIVTASHSHGDHNNVAIIKGNPKVLKEPGSSTIKGIEVKTVSAYHDGAKGTQRGNNLIFCFKVEGLNLCHLGDLGHQLGQQQIKEIGPVDVLFIPVGGFFTIDANEATRTVEAIKPKIVFPMHYKNAKAEYPIAGVDDFLNGKKNVRKLNSSTIEIRKEALPKETEIVVLQPEY